MPKQHCSWLNEDLGDSQQQAMGYILSHAVWKSPSSGLKEGAKMINFGIIFLITQKSKCIFCEYCLRKDCNIFTQRAEHWADWNRDFHRVFILSHPPTLSVGYSSNWCKPGPCGQKHPTYISVTTETVQPVFQGAWKGCCSTLTSLQHSPF